MLLAVSIVRYELRSVDIHINFRADTVFFEPRSQQCILALETLNLGFHTDRITRFKDMAEVNVVPRTLVKFAIKTGEAWESVHTNYGTTLNATIARFYGSIMSLSFGWGKPILASLLATIVTVVSMVEHTYEIDTNRCMTHLARHLAQAWVALRLEREVSLVLPARADNLGAEDMVHPNRSVNRKTYIPKDH